MSHSYYCSISQAAHHEFILNEDNIESVAQLNDEPSPIVHTCIWYTQILVHVQVLSTTNYIVNIMYKLSY